MKITIEDNVPLPAKAKSPKFPWAVMKHGDSFVVEGSINRNRAHASFRAYRKAYVQEHNVLLKIITRQIEPDVYRVWLMEAGRP